MYKGKIHNTPKSKSGLTLGGIDDLSRGHDRTQGPQPFPNIRNVPKIKGGENVITLPGGCFEYLTHRPIPMEGEGGTHTPDAVCSESRALF